MSYDPKFNQDLNEIINLIGEGKITDENGALDKFKIHISEVVQIGHYNKTNWDIDWRECVYKFGTKFKELDPFDFLNALNEAKKELDKDKQEVLDFYYSEIDYNFLPAGTCKTKIESFIEKYPYNPEFRHGLGHFLRDKGNYQEAIEQYNFALNKDKDNDIFLNSLINTYSSYFEILIENSEYQKGLEICEDLISQKIFWEIPIYHSIIVNSKNRFKDYISINKKIQEAEKSIKEIVAKETQKGQFKIIEVLGFFSAIIAFIFSTISIGKNFEFNEAIIFNITLGITLLIFAVVMKLFFSEKDIKLFDYRISILIFLIVCLLGIIIKFGIQILS